MDSHNILGLQVQDITRKQIENPVVADVGVLCWMEMKLFSLFSGENLKTVISLVKQFPPDIIEKIAAAPNITFKCIAERDEVVLSKTVLSNFHPKQPNESIGGPRASIIELFIAILTWPNLTGLNRPLSPFFHPLTLPGYPLCCLFSEN